MYPCICSPFVFVLPVVVPFFVWLSVSAALVGGVAVGFAVPSVSPIRIYSDFL